MSPDGPILGEFSLKKLIKILLDFGVPKKTGKVPRRKSVIDWEKPEVHVGGGGPPLQLRIYETKKQRSWGEGWGNEDLTRPGPLARRILDGFSKEEWVSKFDIFLIDFF